MNKIIRRQGQELVIERVGEKIGVEQIKKILFLWQEKKDEALLYDVKAEKEIPFPQKSQIVIFGKHIYVAFEQEGSLQVCDTEDFKCLSAEKGNHLFLEMKTGILQERNATGEVVEQFNLFNKERLKLRDSII